MTRIESEKADIQRSAESIYNFLTDFNNFGKLMPPQVTNWQSNNDECSFTITGMASISLKIKEKIPPTNINIVSAGKSPFNFELKVILEPVNDTSCKAQVVLEAQLNPMLRMMAEKPLTNFVNLLVKAMKETQF